MGVESAFIQSTCLFGFLGFGQSSILPPIPHAFERNVFMAQDFLSEVEAPSMSILKLVCTFLSVRVRFDKSD